MTKPVLSYFDFPGGRGEDCRLAFFIAGVEFEDDRVQGGSWGDRKATTPFGALPVLKVDGLEIAQSNAILAYVGRQHGLHPAEPMRAAQHEAIMMSVEDLRARVGTSGALDEEAKKTAREELTNGWLRQWAQTVSAQIEGPFLSGAQLNVADLKLFGVMQWFKRGGVDHIGADVFDAYPKLSALFDAVEDHEKVQAWYAAHRA